MAARLALSNITLTKPDGGVLTGVQVIVRRNRMTVQLARHPAPIIDEPASASRQVSRKTWEVVTEAGTYTLVKPAKCVPCGT